MKNTMVASVTKPDKTYYRWIIWRVRHFIVWFNRGVTGIVAGCINLEMLMKKNETTCVTVQPF